MQIMFLIAVLLLLAVGGFFTIKQRILRQIKKEGMRTASLPLYYGWCAIIWSVLPAGVLYFLFVGHVDYWGVAIPVTVEIFSLIAAYFFLSPSFAARRHIERWVKAALWLSAFLSVSVTLLIILSLLFETVRFFGQVRVTEFLFGLHWSPQTALRADQAGATGSFGIVPVFAGTLLVTVIAMGVAAPLGLFSAMYLSEYARPSLRNVIKPMLEILAGIPTVVYGYFAALVFAPMLRHAGEKLGLSVASESALAAGMVMGVMIIPFVLSLTDDVMSAVPHSLREASMGLGATRSETVLKVVFPAALPGIMGALLLAVSRGIGETMIVVMAAGLAAHLTLNPLESVTTVTAQIVTLLVGDQEFDSAKTLAAFALGLTLFVVTLLLNVVALIIVKRYRERYE